MKKNIDFLPPGERHPHGTRARYVGAKCRCLECKAANLAYYHKRNKEKIRGAPWNGIVDAAPARAHLKMLSRAGVGRRQVSEVSGVADTVVQEVGTGKKKRIRNVTLLKILEVDVSAKADHAFVDAKPTHRLVKKLLKLGYTRGALAERMGSEAKTPALQLKKSRVLLRNAHRMQKVFNDIMKEQEIMEERRHVRDCCGRSHRKKDRQRMLVAVLPKTVAALKTMFPCIYSMTSGERTLVRDLHEVGARKEGNATGTGAWHLTTQRRPDEGR